MSDKGLNELRDKIYDIMNFDTLVERGKSQEEIINAQDFAFRAIRNMCAEVLRFIDRNTFEQYYQTPKYLAVNKEVIKEVEVVKEIYVSNETELFEYYIKNKVSFEDAVKKFKSLYVDLAIKNTKTKKDAAELLGIQRTYLSRLLHSETPRPENKIGKEPEKEPEKEEPVTDEKTLEKNINSPLGTPAPNKGLGSTAG